MMTLIAAALAAAPAAQPAQAAPVAHNHHAQHQQQAQKHGDGCKCCKEMMDKMHSEMKRMHDHRERGGN